ncbi:MAG: cell division protein FtsL [Candidatus Accumulibacter sp.]|jgi:cell division protein FtsL|nr:cell division protein FtsL [Accumulibacter sp.]
MARFNLLLLLAIVFCALGVVTSQHEARKLRQAMETEQERARRIEDEFGELQLELRTLADLPKIEKLARERLNMRVPDAARIVVALPGRGR